MSEYQPSQIPHPQAEQVASAQELVAEGGYQKPYDAVAALREQCKHFITSAVLSVDARAHALTKLEEMIFWLRAKE